jgi:hypothetical protein
MPTWDTDQLEELAKKTRSPYFNSDREIFAASEYKSEDVRLTCMPQAP